MLQGIRTYRNLEKKRPCPKRDTFTITVNNIKRNKYIDLILLEFNFYKHICTRIAENLTL